MFMFRQRILLCDSGNPIATDKMKNAIPTLHLAPIALHVRPEDALSAPRQRTGGFRKTAEKPSVKTAAAESSSWDTSATRRITVHERQPLPYTGSGRSPARDNPSLSKAALKGRVLAVYILDDGNAGEFRMGVPLVAPPQPRLAQPLAEGAARAFPWRSAGNPSGSGCRKTGASSVHWNRCYEPPRIRRDTLLRKNSAKRALPSKASTVRCSGNRGR